MDATTCYLENTVDHKLLTADEEKDLLIRAQKSDQEAINLLCELNQRLVLDIAKRYSISKGDQELIDLIQWGNIGLQRAISKFDFSKAKRDKRFSTYAVPWIKSFIRRYGPVRGNALSLSFSHSEARAKVKSAQSRLLARLEHEPSVKELQIETGLSENLISEILEVSTIEYLSIDSDLNPYDPSFSRTVEDILSDDNSDTIEEICEKKNDSDLIRKTIQKCLNQREQYIVEQHYGLTDSGDNQTLNQIAKTLGVSRERVRQIEDGALKKLNRSLANLNFSMS